MAGFILHKLFGIVFVCLFLKKKKKIIKVTNLKLREHLGQYITVTLYT